MNYDEGISKNRTLVENGMDILNSFYEALKVAGGAIEMFELKEMTAYELMSVLATNSIRFKYVRKEE